jgi:hypothetical protein
VAVAHVRSDTLTGDPYTTLLDSTGNLSLLGIDLIAVLYHDLPRTYHDHDCILGHPSDYPRLRESAIRLHPGPTGVDLDRSERVQGPLNL